MMIFLKRAKRKGKFLGGFLVTWISISVRAMTMETAIMLRCVWEHLPLSSRTRRAASRLWQPAVATIMLHCPALQPDVSNMTEPKEKSINARNNSLVCPPLSLKSQIRGSLRWCSGNLAGVATFADNNPQSTYSRARESVKTHFDLTERTCVLLKYRLIWRNSKLRNLFQYVLNHRCLINVFKGVTNDF